MAILGWSRWLPGILVLLPVPSSAQGRFETDVRPILTHYCFQCHGENTKMAGLDLRTPASMRKGGNKGPALVQSSAEGSLLYRRILDKSMPMGDRKLNDAEARVIREWIDAGAIAAESEPLITESTQRQPHWAFRALLPANPSKVDNSAQVLTPVDSFVLAKLAEQHIQPAPPADRLTLLRRAYLDLIGLPPTPDEQTAFLADSAPDAYEKVVENLLARPQYGERWARHWLDVVRYAESNGYERDGVKPSAWRYRDYVIDAFNQDKSYDRFLTEQLAGDEVEHANAETQIATTFLRLGTWDDEPAELLKDRYDQLDDVLGTTASVFLAQTLRCARCHDHKYEPFSQKDYYRMLAVFEPLKRPETPRKYNKFGVLIAHPKELDRLVGAEQELAAYREASDKVDSEVQLLERQIEDLTNELTKRLLASVDKQPNSSSLKWLDHAKIILAFRADPDRLTKEQQELVEKFNTQLEQEYLKFASAAERSQLQRWRREIAEMNRARPKEPPRAYTWEETGTAAPPTHVFARGEPSNPGEEVAPDIPAVLAGAAVPPPVRTRTSTGRRLWLARWMTGSGQALVARVMVNRIWQWTFGDGLAPTANDFGVIAQAPTNPGLLEYLAGELIRSRWSMKHIQRLLVNSSTFRISSTWNEHAASVDPDNRLLWRWKPRRLDAETIRDSMLAVSGCLNPAMGGPSIFPEIPASVLEASLSKRWPTGWGSSDEHQAARRSIYIFAKRGMGVPELEALDAPDTNSSCERRSVSTTGPQALTFLNGDFARKQAHRLEKRVSEEAGPDTGKQISRAFQLVLGRFASAAEIAAAREFLERQQRQIEIDAAPDRIADREARGRAFQALCSVLLNSNEFFYLN